MRLVSNKMKPDISKITADEIAKLNAGICKKMLAIIATMTTIMPVNIKPAPYKCNPRDYDIGNY